MQFCRSCRCLFSARSLYDINIKGPLFFGQNNDIYHYHLLIIGSTVERLEWNKGLEDWRKNRRVVEDVPPWIGWDRLLSYYHKCPTNLHRSIFTILFETGGRVSEVLELQPKQFDWNEEAIKVERMTVLKYRKRMRRDFLIKRDEKNPLAEDLISLVEQCQTKYLFPKQERLSSKVIPSEHTSRTRLYLLVREISDDLWCHWFRAQRASFNVFVRGMDAFQLADWFKWKSVDMPLHYINQTLEGMAKDMGIKNIPKGREERIISLEPKPSPKSEKEKSIRESFAELEESYKRGEME